MSGAENPPSDLEIIVQAYPPRYRAAVTRLLRTEGGARVTDDPVDRGGTTKYGISLRFLAAEGTFDDDHDGKADFDLDMDGDIDGQDVRKLTHGDAVFLYYRCFWKRLSAESFIAPIGEMMFDQAVNGGIVAAKKLLQQAINSCLARIGGNRLLEVDGKLGTETYLAFDRVLQNPLLGAGSLTTAYREAAKDRYRQIVAWHPSQRRFLQGWLNRAEELGR